MRHLRDAADRVFRATGAGVPGDEQGFTLIELLLVIIILSIVATIAFPQYLSLRLKARDTAAKSNIKGLVSAIESYHVDNSSYVGITLPGLKTTYDPALDTSKYVLPAGDLTASGYCVQSTVGNRTWRKNGPAAAFENLACP